ncbi:hypothetical protein PINS_up007175 [Pythium insidiosum]|nr:hypothetical protein PINS_up007175 [Pythium insidiosum]
MERIEVAVLLSPRRRAMTARQQPAIAARREIVVDALEEDAFLKTLEERLQQHIEDLDDVVLVLGARQINYLAFRLHEALEPKRDPDTNLIHAWTIQPQSQLKVKMSSHIQVLKLSTILREVQRLRIFQVSQLRSAIEIEIFPSLQSIAVASIDVSLLRNVHFFARQLRFLQIEHSTMTTLREVLAPTGCDSEKRVVWARLKTLRIGCCALQAIDSSISLLQTTREIDLGWNDISKIECPITVPTLQSLVLCRNKLKHFPPVASLRSLTRLDISMNQIQSIRGVEELVALEELDVSQNVLDNINEIELLRALHNLRRLRLKENPLARRPDHRREVLFFLGKQVVVDDVTWTQPELSTQRFYSPQRWRARHLQTSSMSSLQSDGLRANDAQMEDPKPLRRISTRFSAGGSTTELTEDDETPNQREEVEGEELPDGTIVRTVGDFFNLEDSTRRRNCTVDSQGDGTDRDVLIPFSDSDSDTSSSSELGRRSRKYTETDFMRDFEEEQTLIKDGSINTIDVSITGKRNSKQSPANKELRVRVLLSSEDASVYDLAFGIDGLPAVVTIKSHEIMEVLYAPDRDTPISFCRRIPDIISIGTSASPNRSSRIMLLRLRKADAQSFGEVTYQVDDATTFSRILGPLLSHMFAVGPSSTPIVYVCANCSGLSHLARDATDTRPISAASIMVYVCLLCASRNVREISTDRMVSTHASDGISLSKRLQPSTTRATADTVASGFYIEEFESDALPHECHFIAACGIRELPAAALREDVEENDPFAQF